MVHPYSKAHLAHYQPLGLSIARHLALLLFIVPAYTFSPGLAHFSLLLSPSTATTSPTNPTPIDRPDIFQ